MASSSPLKGRKLQLHEKDEAEQNASNIDGSPWTGVVITEENESVESPQATVEDEVDESLGEPFVVTGTIWYDRNSNGKRDSGISMTNNNVKETNVEYGIGLGGAKVTLVECDTATNREIESSELAATISKGYNSKMEPMLSSGGGVYKLVNVKANQSYAVKVEAPTGYLFTSGICNDDTRGWECVYSGDNGDSLSIASGARSKEYAMGIASGRSNQCITVGSSGVPNKALNFGALRIGDSKTEKTDVALVLEFDQAATSRRLNEMIRGAALLSDVDDFGARYLLGERDRSAIGSITAEVLASQLDKRLAKNQIILGDVKYQDVVLSRDSEESKKQMFVSLNVEGRYTPPPELDFEYIVSDSINSGTEMLRRDLMEYNQKCRIQTTNSGANSNVHFAGCTEGKILPAIFETSLSDVSAVKVSDIVFPPVTYYEQDALAPWALGPLAAVGGLIALLIGAFVFRRALGPRKVVKYDQLEKADGESKEMLQEDLDGSMSTTASAAKRRRSFN